MTKCNCKTLEEMSKELDSPFIFNQSKKTFELRLDASKQFAMSYCTFCGGDVQKFRIKFPDGCECGIVQKWANDPNLFIKRDSSEGHYYFVHQKGFAKSGDRRTPLHWCPACGNHLGKTDNQSRTEIEKFHEQLKDAKTLTQVVQILGKPDGVFIEETTDNYVIHKPSGIKDLEASNVNGITYRHLSPTVHIWVTKVRSKSGELSINAFQAKVRNPSK
jgi:hypothetical protein